ncbi:RIP metalloprotease RseP [Oryzibacter oryziterrae]|uniref:RIP metalloprotease RseP n=1 Tax=Oryzibacter oryziterrae TaxID=2766474 RepID=UPI001F032711|nr:RIP metalloprotease RseP [Oryzibacter oryziterrae]
MTLPALLSLLQGTVLPFLVVLLVVVFVHELGHFWVARRVGVAVSTFSIGFGPELFGRTDSKGTRWRVAAIPLGGYVKFIDDMNAASVPNGEQATVEGSFQSKSLAARAAVVAAGPFANFLFAIAVLSTLFYVYGRPYLAPIAQEVTVGSPAEAAGIRAGDRVVSVDGYGVDSFEDIQRIIVLRRNVDIPIEVERDGQRLVFNATPRDTEITDAFGHKQTVPVLGLKQTKPSVEIRSFTPWGAVGEALHETASIVETSLSGVAGMFSGRTSTSQISGPIGIAQISGQMASLGFLPLINLAAILSISIGLINLFPIPLLDGGHLAFYALEAVRGRPLSERAQEIGFGIGLALVLGLMAFGVINDVAKLATG